MPSLTRPKAENLPSSGGCGEMQTKNCAPSLSGLPGMLTVETTPRSCLRSLNSPGELIEAAGAPEFAGRFGIFEQRVAALDDAVGDDAMEGAAVVVALAGEVEEVLDVLGRFIGRELDAEGAEVGGDDGFEIGGRLG